MDKQWISRFRDDLENALDAPTRGDIATLLREYDRMREIVEAVALRELTTQYLPANSGPAMYRCVWCHEVAYTTSRIRHHPQCEGAKARALVGLPEKSQVEDEMARAEQKQRENADAVADGMWPPHPSEY